MACMNLNLDPQVICPYNSSHIIAKSRIRGHLAKCEKNYPPDYLKICPYDATHRFHAHEMESHVESCPQKWQNHYWQAQKDVPDSDVESLVKPSDDDWEENICIEPLPKEPQSNIIRPMRFEVRANAVTARRIGSTLRRPYGLSESMMLDASALSAHNGDENDDASSISSAMNWGRGQTLLRNGGPALTQIRGNHPVRPIRGIGALHQRGSRNG